MQNFYPLKEELKKYLGLKEIVKKFHIYYNTKRTNYFLALTFIDES